jgi:hypothetical protein
MVECGIKNYDDEATINGMNSLPNFMKIRQLFQKLLVGDTQTAW